MKHKMTVRAVWIVAFLEIGLSLLFTLL